MEDGVDAKGVRDEHQDCDEQWEQSKDIVDLGGSFKMSYEQKGAFKLFSSVTGDI